MALKMPAFPPSPLNVGFFKPLPFKLAECLCCTLG